MNNKHDITVCGFTLTQNSAGAYIYKSDTDNIYFKIVESYPGSGFYRGISLIYKQKFQSAGYSIEDACSSLENEIAKEVGQLLKLINWVKLFKTFK